MKRFLLIFVLCFVVTMLLGTVAHIIRPSFGMDLVLALSVGVGIGNGLWNPVMRR